MRDGESMEQFLYRLFEGANEQWELTNEPETSSKDLEHALYMMTALGVVALLVLVLLYPH